MERSVVNLYEYSVDYDDCFNHNFKNNVQEAVKFYLGMSDEYLFMGGTDDSAQHTTINGFVLYPHALNPFLKIMETLKETRNIIILPSFNNDRNDTADDINAPAYLIVKIGRTGFVTKLIATG